MCSSRKVCSEYLWADDTHGLTHYDHAFSDSSLEDWNWKFDLLSSVSGPLMRNHMTVNYVSLLESKTLFLCLCIFFSHMSPDKEEITLNPFSTMSQLLRNRIPSLTIITDMQREKIQKVILDGV